MIKILWIFVGLHSTALLVFIRALFMLTVGKNFKRMENGWTSILLGLGLLVLLLAVLPLHFGNSTFSQIFGVLFAVLLSHIVLAVLLSRTFSSFKKQKSFAQTFDREETQIAISLAIEKNDSTLFRQVIDIYNLTFQGVMFWEWNYLQSAVRLLSNPTSFAVNYVANLAFIHILLKNGCDATPTPLQRLMIVFP